MLLFYFIAIANMKSSLFTVDLSTVQTNILIVQLDRHQIEPGVLQNRLENVLEDDKVKISVRVTPRDMDAVRFVTYWEITDDDIDAAIERIVYVMGEFQQKFDKASS